MSTLDQQLNSSKATEETKWSAAKRTIRLQNQLYSAKEKVNPKKWSNENSNMMADLQVRVAES